MNHQAFLNNQKRPVISLSLARLSFLVLAFHGVNASAQQPGIGLPFGAPATESAPSLFTRESDERAKALKPAEGAKVTEIESLHLDYDPRASTAVFVGKVTVKHPDFTMQCDRLTAIMKGDDKKKDPNALKSTGPAGGGLKKAIAEGHVVIVQRKKELDGSVSQSNAWADKAVYESSNGDMILTGRPVVQQGINICESLSNETVMVLNKAGKSTVDGPNRMRIHDTAGTEPKP